MQDYAPDSRGQTWAAADALGYNEKQQGNSESSESEILLAIADLIVASRTIPDLFKALVPFLRELAKCDVVSFALYDPKQNGIVTDFWKSGQEEGLGKTFRVEDSPCGWVWQQQRPMTIPDLERETRFAGVVQELRNLGLRSFTALPLTTPKHRYGALGIGKRQPETGATPNLPVLERAARLTGLAVENHEVHSQWLKQQNRLRSLVAISEFATLDLDQLIPRIFSTMQQATNYDYARLALLEPETRSLRVRGLQSGVAQGIQLREGQLIPVTKSISAQAIETRRVTFHAAEDLAKFNGAVAGEIRSAGVQSLCSVPLTLGNRVLGTMLVGAIREHAFSREDGEYLLQIGTQIAAAFHNASTYRQATQTKDRLNLEKRNLESEIRGEAGAEEIVGKSLALKRVLDHAAVVAPTNATVLITGETGTGKERIARAIHLMSPRRENAFVKLNCAAIPTGLLESELFGHEKGAFTSAVSQKVGRLELADKGTLLLDEVGEIPLELQPKLLRVLQDQEFERLGGTKTIRVDVRLVAASNRDLERAVEEKHFRSDLFYRLHVFPLHLPALRQRRDDIPLLIRHFVEKYSRLMNRHIDLIPDEAVQAMMNWDWPGNIRELENFIERSVILSDDNRLRPPLHELREPVWKRQLNADGTLRGRERDHIIDILRQTKGVLSGPTGAASRLGLKRTTLQYKIQRLGISRLEYLD